MVCIQAARGQEVLEERGETDRPLIRHNAQTVSFSDGPLADGSPSGRVHVYLPCPGHGARTSAERSPRTFGIAGADGRAPAGESAEACHSRTGRGKWAGARRRDRSNPRGIPAIKQRYRGYCRVDIMERRGKEFRSLLSSEDTASQQGMGILPEDGLRLPRSVLDADNRRWGDGLRLRARRGCMSRTPQSKPEAIPRSWCGSRRMDSNAPMATSDGVSDRLHRGRWSSLDCAALVADAPRGSNC